MNRLTLMIAACGLALSAGQAAAGNNCTTPANVNAMAQEIAQGVNANRRANLHYHCAPIRARLLAP